MMNEIVINKDHQFTATDLSQTNRLNQEQIVSLYKDIK